MVEVVRRLYCVRCGDAFTPRGKKYPGSFCSQRCRARWYSQLFSEPCDRGLLSPAPGKSSAGPVASELTPELQTARWFFPYQRSKAAKAQRRARLAKLREQWSP